jgi:flagellar basal-body rod protein FlgC
MSNIEPQMRHDPNNPLADADGNVWDAGVDEAAELIDMIETARQYQNNVQVMQTAKSLILDTVRMGQ